MLTVYSVFSSEVFSLGLSQVPQTPSDRRFCRCTNSGSHAIDSGSDDAGIKEDFLQRKHLDFMFSSPPEMNYGGDSMIQCVF